MSKHIDTHPVHSPYTCRMCGRGFDAEKDLKNHRVASHVIRPYKCKMCDKTFKKKETLIDHRRIHLRVKLPGQVKVIESGIVVKEPVIKIEEEEPETDYQCTTCGICLSTQQMLDQHLQQHELATESFPCKHCDRIFFSENLLTIHCMKDHKVFPENKVI